MRTLTLTVLALAGCSSAQQFDLTTNGQHSTTVNARALVTTESGSRVIKVCGDYPTIPNATDSGGTLCLSVGLDAAQLSATTFTIAGHATQAEDGTRPFVSGASGSAAVTSAWFNQICFCPLLTDESLEGTITLHHVDAQRVVGELSVTVVSGSQTFVVRAAFDAAG